MSNTNFFLETNDSDATKRDNIVIPIIEETVLIGKKVQETGTVIIKKEVSETSEAVNVNLLNDEYSVEHVAINKYADNDEAPKATQIGDTLIIPVVKEVLVKRLLVVEEIRITKRIVERNEQHNVRLRKESVTVERTPKNEVK